MRQIAQLHAALTPREMQVLYFIVSARSMRDAADILQISQHTARRHRRCICEKLYVRNSAELLRKAFLEGWVGWRDEAGDARLRRPPPERVQPLRPALRHGADTARYAGTPVAPAMSMRLAMMRS